MPYPLISILTPVYNAGSYLHELIESVLAQKYATYEHVLIDDGSTDNGETVRILSSYPHLRWKSRENHGQYYTQNELFELAKGDVVTVICADDMYVSPDSLQTIARIFDKTPTCDVAFGRTVSRVMKHPQYEFSPELPGWIARRGIRYYSSIQHCSMFVKKQFLLETGIRFNSAYGMRGDWDWVQNVLERARTVRWTGEPIAYWRHHLGQTSKREPELGAAESFACCRAHSTSYAMHRAVAFVTATLIGRSAAAWGMGRTNGLSAVARALRNHVGGVGDGK